MPIALTITTLPLVVAGLAASIAAATDLWRFKVYNALTLPTLGLGLIAAVTVGGWPGLRVALLGAGLGFVVLLALHALGGVGAGDVKLLTALGAWLGPDWLVRVFAASALATGAYALALVAWRRGLTGVAAEWILARHALAHPSTLRRAGGPDLAAELARPDRRLRLVPFAAMTCVGFFAVLLGDFGQPTAATPMAPSGGRLAVVTPVDAGVRSAPSHGLTRATPFDSPLGDSETVR